MNQKTRVVNQPNNFCKVLNHMCNDDDSPDTKTSSWTRNTMRLCSIHPPKPGESKALQCRITVKISQDLALRLERSRKKEPGVGGYGGRLLEKTWLGRIIHCTCSDNVQKPYTGFPEQDDTCMNEAAKAGCQHTNTFILCTHTHSCLPIIIQWNRCSTFVHKHNETEEMSKDIIGLQKNNINNWLSCCALMCSKDSTA